MGSLGREPKGEGIEGIDGIEGGVMLGNGLRSDSLGSPGIPMGGLVPGGIWGRTFRRALRTALASHLFC